MQAFHDNAPDVPLPPAEGKAAPPRASAWAFDEVSAMKTVLKILFAGLLLTSVAGCTTSTPKVSSDRRPAAKRTDLNDARLLYELGEFDAAEQKLRGVLLNDRDNPRALRLLVLVEKGRFRRESGQEQPWGYYQTIPPQPIYR